MLDMCNSTGSPIFSDFKSDLSRVVHFLTAGQEEGRPQVQGWCFRDVSSLTSCILPSHSHTHCSSSLPAKPDQYFSIDGISPSQHGYFSTLEM